ncbi:hypothetical protein EI77_04645 [Prosthecobacter fusiformis]|uniref:Uncharacterized protein n=1 Tax=Prosthecobacter fusiformis TaxID=48464 RepID=A0A4V6Q581_9BACT|nr:hypothetical protein EI77_04645 [Prosthecobacter fusiformis]
MILSLHLNVRQKKMNLHSLLRTFGVISLQIVIFFVSWSLMVKIARNLDRFRPELFFGITLSYGAIGMVFLFVICGIVTSITKQARLYWSAIFLGLALWLAWLFPSFSSRPYSMPAFFMLGSTLLILGSGVVLPRLLQRA